MARQMSKKEAELEARLKQLDPSSERYRVLSAARAFRASWVQLGEWLTQVRDNSRHEPWGYSTFEDYCTRELGLKRDTALKLTRSFAFLRDSEPQALQRGSGGRELPPLDVVDMLSQARERTRASDDDIAAITREVLSAGDGAQPPTRQQVVKRFRELDPDAFKGRGLAAGGGQDADATGNDASDDPQELRKALLLAERLQLLLETHRSALSAEAVGGVRRAVLELRTRFEECRRRSA